jgi:hypothetical protein
MNNKQEIQEELFYQQMMAQSQNSQSNFDMMREKLAQNPSPDNNYESAVFLVSNSDLTNKVPEIDKEVKLANLENKEKEQVNSYLFAYQDLQLIHELQIKKFQQGLNVKEYKEFIKNNRQNKLDQLNFLRRGLTISAVSRGTQGFERKAQNTIISQANFNAGLEEQKTTSRFNKMLGVNR